MRVSGLCLDLESSSALRIYCVIFLSSGGIFRAMVFSIDCVLTKYQTGKDEVGADLL